MAKPTRPPAPVPLPRPLTRESQLTTNTAMRATRARGERLGVMVLTLTTRKHKRANRGGGWPFCKTFALLKRGVLRRTGDTHYAGHERINQQDYVDICHLYNRCLLYTSDAADEEDSVDLGGRRIIKQQKTK